MDDSTLRKAQALLDRLRRKPESSARRRAAQASDPASNNGSSATDGPDAPGISIRNILREENRHLADELMGLIREASDAESKASAVNSTTSVAVQTDSPTPPRLVPHVGGVEIQSIQPHEESRLTSVSRVGAIKILPSEPEADAETFTCRPHVGATEIVPTQCQVNGVKPTLLPRVSAVEILPAQQASEPPSSSNFASNETVGRPTTGVAASAPYTHTDATPWQLVIRNFLGSASLYSDPESLALYLGVYDREGRPHHWPPRGTVVRPGASEPRNVFEKTVRVQFIGRKSIDIKLPNVPSVEYEATRPWLFSGLHASERVLRDATDRLTLCPDDPAALDYEASDKDGESVVGDNLDEFEEEVPLAPGDTASLGPSEPWTPPDLDLEPRLKWRDMTASPDKHNERRGQMPAGRSFHEKPATPLMSHGPLFREMASRESVSRDTSWPIGRPFGGTMDQEIPEPRSIFGESVGGSGRINEGQILRELPIRGQDAGSDDRGESRDGTPSRSCPGAVFGRVADEDMVFNFDYCPPRGFQRPADKRWVQRQKASRRN